MLQSMGLQRAGHDLATEQQQWIAHIYVYIYISVISTMGPRNIEMAQQSHRGVPVINLFLQNFYSYLRFTFLMDTVKLNCSPKNYLRKTLYASQCIMRICIFTRPI